MQVQKFKRRIFIESGIYGTILVVLMIGAYLLDNLSDDYTENNRAEQDKVNAIQAELGALQKRYDFIKQNLDLYNEIKSDQSEGRLNISRQTMFEKFTQFKSQFDLSNLHLTVSPISEFKNEKFKRKTNIVNFSNVEAELDVLYDENVYELINAMQSELSGICVLSKLSMEMPAPLDPAILRVIATKGTYPLIKTKLQFSWYSINPLETSDASKDATKK